jgi:hypothetical protein
MTIIQNHFPYSIPCVSYITIKKLEHVENLTFEYAYLVPGGFLVLLEPYSAALSCSLFVAAALSSKISWANNNMPGSRDDNYYKAKQEFVSSKRINGYVAILNEENTSKVVWLSHYDVESLKWQQSKYAPYSAAK